MTYEEFVKKQKLRAEAFAKELNSELKEFSVELEKNEVEQNFPSYTDDKGYTTTDSPYYDADEHIIELIDTIIVGALTTNAQLSEDTVDNLVKLNSIRQTRLYEVE